MAIQTYRDLEVWQRSMDLVVEVYRLTKRFPHEEQFGLTSQLRRAAVSVPSNIAEGHGRLHRAEFLRHLSIAKGSLTEAETQFLIAIRLDYLKKEEVQEDIWRLFQEVGRLLNGLIRSLDNSEPGSRYAGRLLEETEPYEANPCPTPDP